MSPLSGLKSAWFGPRSQGSRPGLEVCRPTGSRWRPSGEDPKTDCETGTSFGDVVTRAPPSPWLAGNGGALSRRRASHPLLDRGRLGSRPRSDSVVNEPSALRLRRSPGDKPRLRTYRTTVELILSTTEDGNGILVHGSPLFVELRPVAANGRPASFGGWPAPPGDWPAPVEVRPLPANHWPASAVLSSLPAGLWPRAAGGCETPAGGWPLPVGERPLPAGRWPTPAGRLRILGDRPQEPRHPLGRTAGREPWAPGQQKTPAAGPRLSADPVAGRAL